MLNFENIFKKFKLTNKGQAFSTFQLLIAAVVALALLGVLLPIIMKNVNIGNNLHDSAQTLLRGQVNNPGDLRFTEEVKIGKDDSLSAASLSEGTGLDRSQVCITTEDGSEAVFESIGNGSGIRYKSSSSLKYKIGVICDYRTYIEDSLGKFSINADNIKCSKDIFDTDEDGETVCVVFPRRI